MERPAKRLRLSPRDEDESTLSYTNAANNQNNIEFEQMNVLDTLITTQNPPPTRTSNLRDFQPRRPYGKPAAFAKRDLRPRAPDVTVTANVINIAILDGLGKTSFTEIPAPTTTLELPISGVGTVTVPGLNSQNTASKSSSIGTTSGSLFSTPSGLSSTTTLSSPTTTVNGTSTGERTVTVTSTSLLSVTARNGTTVASSASRHKTVISIEGFTTTLDDLRTQTYRFGDLPGSTQTDSPTNAYQSGIAASTTTSSSGEATSTAAAPGPGVVLTPQQQQVVGGVVGGVAGVTLVLLGILYFLKWYRQRLKAQGRLPEQMSRHRQLPSGDGHEYVAPPTMTQQHPTSLIPIAGLKQSLQKIRPHSTHTLTSTSSSQPTVPESERSFQRISGRKIPSVLLTGGNGYGDQGPVSPISENYSLPRSRDVSQASSTPGNNAHTNPFMSPAIHGTPPRPNDSPFLDPPAETQPAGTSYVRTPTATRDFAALRSSRSNLTIETGGLSALNPNRNSDGNIMIRPSPARTPTTSSPTSSSLKLPMHTPPLMSGDIPEMPPLQPWRHTMGPRKFSDDTLSVQRSLGQRSMSAMSIKSSHSVGGKFREEI